MSVLLLFWTHWGQMLVASVVMGLFVYYLTRVAPSLVPVPADVQVPFPAATRYLERVCAWCGEHPGSTAGIAAAALAPGFIFRRSRYSLWVLILVSLTFCFTYLSISAPIDRLLHGVERSLPERREVPDYLPGSKGHR